MFLVGCLPLVLAPILPTIDFYDHISRYFVLSHLGQDVFLRENYTSNWSLLPNIGLDVLGTILLRYVDVLAAAKIVALVIFATQYFGVIFFNRMITGKWNLAAGLLSGMFLYSFIFTWGFANFLLGLGLVFWGGGIWLATRRRLVVAILLSAVVAIIIFLTHGVAFALYGLLLGGLELGTYLSGPRDVMKLSRRLVALATLAIVPGTLFLHSATIGAADGVTNAGASIDRLSSEGLLVPRLIELVIYRLQTVVRVAEGPALWLDIVTFAIIGVGLVWLIRCDQVEIPKAALPALLIGALLVIAVPPAMFGVGYVSDRMPLYLALLFTGSLYIRPGVARETRMAVLGLAMIVAIRVALVAANWMSYDSDFADYERVASHIPPGRIVGYISGALEPRITGRRRCEMYGPLLVSRHGQASALFAIPTAQPMKLQGKLQQALKDMPEHRRASGDEAAAHYREEMDAMMSERIFDYVLVCDLAALGRRVPAESAVVDSAGRFTLLRTH